jgi:hypothetical protein
MRTGGGRGSARRWRGSACGGRGGRAAIAIGLHTAPHMPVATRLYERVGFRRAPAFDIEIGEMFTGRSLAREHSWMALAYQLDLKEI